MNGSESAGELMGLAGAFMDDRSDLEFLPHSISVELALKEVRHSRYVDRSTSLRHCSCVFP